MSTRTRLIETLAGREIKTIADQISRQARGSATRPPCLCRIDMNLKAGDVHSLKRHHRCKGG